MKPVRACIEVLESRIAPATLDVVSGVLTYSGSGLISNVLTLSVSGANYSFADTAETITLTVGAISAGFSGGGTNTVIGPQASLSSITIVLGLGDDVLSVTGLNDPLTVTEGVGADTVTMNAIGSNAGGAVTIAAEAVNIGNLFGVTTLDLTTDNISVNANITASGTAVIRPLTPGRQIDLGTNNSSRVSLTDVEVDRLSAGVLEIGSATAGSVFFTNTITTGGTSTMVVRTGASILDAHGGVDLTVANLALSAPSGVGSVSDWLDTSATRIEAVASTGGLFIENASAELRIGGVDAVIEGVQVTTSGDLSLRNEGSIILDGTQTEDIRTISGDVFVHATGVTANVETRNSSADAIDSGAGAVTIAAGQDLLIGSAATDKFGDVEAEGNLHLIAGRDIILDENSFVDTFGSGNIEISAGRNVSLLASDGTIGSRIATQGGSISISTSANGTFTATSGAAKALNANGASFDGAITIEADDMVINNVIDAGTSTVDLRAASLNRLTDLGSNTAGRLGLADAELDLVIASTLRIGTEFTDSIAITGVNSPAQVTTLVLASAQPITTSGGAGLIVPNLVMGNTTLSSQFVIFTSGSTTQTGVFSGSGGIDFSGGTLQLSAANTYTGTTSMNSGTLTGTGSVSGPVQLAPGATISPGSGPGTLGLGNLTLSAGSTFVVDLNGTAVGSGYDQLAVTGSLDLTGAALSVDIGFAAAPATEFIIISNDDSDPVAGTFVGRPEGLIFPIDGQLVRISYVGGDGNDVTLQELPALDVTLVNSKTVQFTDVDGDLVTVRTNKGIFDGSEFIGVELGENGEGQLQKLKLDSDFTGANITITAKRTALGGNGFVNLGALDATDVDLGIVKIAGDLGVFFAGTSGGDAKVPALKLLSVKSIGLLGVSTQDSEADYMSLVQGGIGTFSVAGDMRGSLFLNGMGADAKIGKATIGGNITAFSTGIGTQIFARAGIGSMKVGGDIRASAAAPVGIFTEGAIGSLSVGGAILGVANGQVSIGGVGKLVAPTKGLDFAIQALSVRGTVEFANINAGSVGSQRNADASIGRVLIGGDMISSRIIAGVFDVGTDGVQFTNDDTVGSSTRDNEELHSTIRSLQVAGQVVGSPLAGDMFGVLAERVELARISQSFIFRTEAGEDANPGARFASGTGAGAGEENPAFDVIVREFGSLTPSVAFGGSSLDISDDGRSATYIDVDGDIVTVTRSAGAFVPGDFTIVDNPAGGGQLQKLIITAAPDGVVANLSITAVPGPNGGNGTVNVGSIEAAGVDLGKVTVEGDLTKIAVGNGTDTKPAARSLAVHSLGTLGSSTQAMPDIQNSFAGDVGKIAIKTDLRFVSITATGKIGSLSADGSMLGDFLMGGIVNAAKGIGTAKVGGSVLGMNLITTAGSIGSISIGGDLGIYGFLGSQIQAFGQTTAPSSGLDFAIKSIAIKGSVERSLIGVGTDFSFANADASIGAVSVGRNWIASNLLAGVGTGGDFKFGTSDDTEVTGFLSTRNEDAISTIASITIKGQAFGTAAGGDHFGIVAQQIRKAQIGGAKLALRTGAQNTSDAFPIAPTGLDAAGLFSDFYLREIVNG